MIALKKESAHISSLLSGAQAKGTTKSFVGLTLPGRGCALGPAIHYARRNCSLIMTMRPLNASFRSVNIFK